MDTKDFWGKKEKRNCLKVFDLFFYSLRKGQQQSNVAAAPFAERTQGDHPRKDLPGDFLMKTCHSQGLNLASLMVFCKCHKT